MTEGHNSGDTDAACRARADRIVRLTEERKGLAEDIKGIYLEEKGAGGDPPVLRQMVKTLMESEEARAERERVQEEADRKLAAFGPLGEAAVAARPKIRAVR